MFAIGVATTDPSCLEPDGHPKDKEMSRREPGSDLVK